MKRLRKSKLAKKGRGSRRQQIQNAVEKSLRRVGDERKEIDNSDSLTEEDFPLEEDDNDDNENNS